MYICIYIYIIGRLPKCLILGWIYAVRKRLVYFVYFLLRSYASSFQNLCILLSLVGGFNPSDKYENQLRWLFPIYAKIKVMFQTTNQKLTLIGFFCSWNAWLESPGPWTDPDVPSQFWENGSGSSGSRRWHVPQKDPQMDPYGFSNGKVLLLKTVRDGSHG